MNASAYREPEVRPKRRFDVRATVMLRSSYFVLPLFLVGLLLPFFSTPTRVDVSCSGLTDRCQILTQRVFGLVTDATDVDVPGIGNVRIMAVAKKDYLEVEDQGVVHRWPVRFGGGSNFVVHELLTFRAQRTVPRESLVGSHSGDAAPLVFLFGPLSIWLVFLARFVARVRIEAESDDVQLIVTVARWPFRSRSTTFDVQNITGANVRRTSHRGPKGGTTWTRTVDLRLRTGAYDLFPAGLPDSSTVDELARGLDHFVRFGASSP